MEFGTTVFAIPTYRLRDVAEAIKAYHANVWRNSHVVKPMVFDDVVSQIHSAPGIWPSLLGICYHHKDKKPFLPTKVRNKRLEAHR